MGLNAHQKSKHGWWGIAIIHPIEFVIHLKIMYNTPIFAPIMEQRSKPRINCLYPAIVQGMDAGGRKFRTNATLINMSATGLHLVFTTEVRPHKALFVLFRCSSTGPLGKGKAPLIAVEGSIVRSRLLLQGGQSVALKISHNRFL
jgi:hypothetical protein